MVRVSISLDEPRERVPPLIALVPPPVLCRRVATFVWHDVPPTAMHPAVARAADNASNSPLKLRKSSIGVHPSGARCFVPVTIGIGWG